MDNYEKCVQYIFRIVCKDWQSAEEMTAKIPNLSSEIYPFFKNKEQAVLSFGITELVDLEVLKLLVDNPNCVEFSTFISIATERDSDGVRVPQPVLDIIRKIGGNLDFSFTIT